MKELFEKILYRALKQHATDIHLYLEKQLKIQFRIYGDLYEFDVYPFEQGERLMNYIKYQSSINTNYRLSPQTGDFHISLENKVYALRVSYLPSLDFESIVIRILNNHKPISLNKLTRLKNIQDYLYSLVYRESGLFLISGATGSGKSTTLYAIIDEISQLHTKNIITIEDPIEMEKEGCLQIELNEKLGITYQNCLKQILRHDPDVIMIGEIRDEKTAAIALTCALTGHLVLTTIHASNAKMALKRIMNLGIQSTDLQDVLIGSLSQKLIYDKDNQDVIVIAELLDRNQIKHYLSKDYIEYDDFLIQIQKLIDQGVSKSIFKETLYE